MEVLRMNYYFTGLLILALTILALFVEPAYPRNEYLNEYGVRCGEVQIKQQLELMKMCGRVNSNPSLAYNSNFDLLVAKCRGVTPARDNTRPSDSQSLWDDMKDEYKKENPDVQLMGDKFIKPSKKKLIIPKYLTEEGSVILPLPKPKDD
jgi:hypothetical protein